MATLNDYRVSFLDDRGRSVASASVRADTVTASSWLRSFRGIPLCQHIFVNGELRCKRERGVRTWAGEPLGAGRSGLGR